MSCGAYGIDDEGRLISCVQCGQSYHPYCVEVKVDMTSILIGLLLDMIYVCTSISHVCRYYLCFIPVSFIPRDKFRIQFYFNFITVL